jgi:hypothetical protein
MEELDDDVRTPLFRGGGDIEGGGDGTKSKNHTCFFARLFALALLNLKEVAPHPRTQTTH